MFIEVVHANGLYDFAHENHSDPMAKSKIIKLVHLAINDAVSEQGAEVLYRPNYGWFTEEVERDPLKNAASLASDPFLSGLKPSVRDLVVICPDGADLPASRQLATYTLEAERVRRNDKTIVLGAYLSVCVLAAAEGIKRRVPDSNVGIDPFLSLGGYGQTWEPNDCIYRDNLAAYLSPSIGSLISASFAY